MEQHLIVAIKAIIPLFLLIGVGIYIRWQKMLTDTELQHVNSMIFRIFFFCMMFYNMYTTTLATALRPRLIVFTVVSLFVMLLISAVVVCTVEKDNRSRGAMLQALFRSNFVLLGIPLVENIFGSEALAVPTMMIAFISPIYNTVSIFFLDSPGRAEKPHDHRRHSGRGIYAFGNYGAGACLKTDPPDLILHFSGGAADSGGFVPVRGNQ